MSCEELTKYRIFLEKIAALYQNQPDEEILLAKTAPYRFTKKEVYGELVNWTLQYLHENNCPTKLIAPIVQNVVELILSESIKNPTHYGFDNQLDTFNPLKLKNLVISSINAFCQRLLDNVELNKILPAVDDEKSDDIPISIHGAVKNRRRYMEDRHICVDDFKNTFNIQDFQKSSFYAVFDGHGGFQASAYASAQLANFLATNPILSTNPTEALRQSFLATDNASIEKNIKGGTTAVCALYLPEALRLYIAWVGDSQALMVKQGKIMQIVKPHKPEYVEEKSRIRNSGGFVMQRDGVWRVDGILNLSRAIGDNRFKPYITAEPDIVGLEMDNNEDFLVLACDGLWDHVDQSEIASIVYNQIKEDCENLNKVPEKLIEKALSEGSTDNITVIIIFFNHPCQIVKNSWPIQIMEPAYDNCNIGTLTNLKQDLAENANTETNLERDDFTKFLSDAHDQLQAELSPKIDTSNGQQLMQQFNDGLNNLIQETTDTANQFLNNDNINNPFGFNNKFDENDEIIYQKNQDMINIDFNNDEDNDGITTNQQKYQENENFSNDFTTTNNSSPAKDGHDNDFGPETCVDVTDDVIMTTETSDTTNLLEHSTLSHSKDTLPSSDKDNLNPFDNKAQMLDFDSNEFQREQHLHDDDDMKSTPMISPESEEIMNQSDGMNDLLSPDEQPTEPMACEQQNHHHQENNLDFVEQDNIIINKSPVDQEQFEDGLEQQLKPHHEEINNFIQTNGHISPEKNLNHSDFDQQNMEQEHDFKPIEQIVPDSEELEIQILKTDDNFAMVPNEINVQHNDFKLEENFHENLHDFEPRGISPGGILEEQLSASISNEALSDKLDQEHHIENDHLDQQEHIEIDNRDVCNLDEDHFQQNNTLDTYPEQGVMPELIEMTKNTPDDLFEAYQINANTEFPKHTPENVSWMNDNIKNNEDLALLSGEGEKQETENTEKATEQILQATSPIETTEKIDLEKDLLNIATSEPVNIDKKESDPTNLVEFSKSPGNLLGSDQLTEIDDDMNHPLNPEAKEFVPTSPPDFAAITNGFPKFQNVQQQHRLEDDVVAQSPRKGLVNMENIQVPEEDMFDKEADQRPHEVEEDLIIPETAPAGCGILCGDEGDHHLHRNQNLNLKESMHASEKENDLLPSPVTTTTAHAEPLVGFNPVPELENAEMNKSIYIENSSSQLDTDERDLLNQVQLIPDLKEEINNSHNEVLPAVTENKLNGELHDNLINCNTIGDAMQLGSGEPAFVIPVEDQKLIDSPQEVATATTIGVVVATVVAATTNTVKNKSKVAEKNLKNKSEQASKSTKVPEVRKTISKTNTAAPVSAPKKLTSTLPAKSADIAAKPKTTLTAAKPKTLTVATAQPPKSITFPRPRTAPTAGTTTLTQKNLTEKKPASTVKSRIDTKPSSTLLNKKPSVVSTKSNEGTTVTKTTTIKSTVSKTGVAPKLPVTSKTITRPTSTTTTNGPAAKVTAAPKTLLVKTTTTSATKLSPRSTVTSALRKTEAVKSPTKPTTTSTTAARTSTTSRPISGIKTTTTSSARTGAGTVRKTTTTTTTSSTTSAGTTKKPAPIKRPTSSTSPLTKKTASTTQTTTTTTTITNDTPNDIALPPIKQLENCSISDGIIPNASSTPTENEEHKFNGDMLATIVSDNLPVA